MSQVPVAAAGRRRIPLPPPRNPTAALLGAWAAIHGTRTAGLLLGAVALASLLLGGRELGGVGFVRFVAPVSVLLLLPLVAGVAVAVASIPALPRSLPDPARVRAARVGWTLAWCGGATAVCAIGLLFGATAPGGAVTRNVATLTGLALLVSRLDEGRHVWAPPVMLVLVAMLFGHPDVGPDYHWWAWIMEERLTTVGVAAAAVLLAAGLVVVAMPRSPRRA